MEEMATIPRSEYELLKRENADFRFKIEELLTIVQQLELTIALMKGSKKSRTSSVAPSQDLARCNTISLRTPKSKVFGQFSIDQGKGADRYAKISSVIDTTIKNGQDV